MTGNISRRFCGSGCVVLLASFSLQMVLSSDLPAWDLDLEHPVRFQRAMDENLLLAGTERHLFGVDMKSGKTLWRFRNIQLQQDDVLAVPFSNVVILSEGWGGEFKDKESNVLAINYLTGERLWESPTIKERVLSVVPDLENGRVLMVTAKKPHGKGRGHFERKPRLYLLDTLTGKILWKIDVDQEIRLTPLAQTEDQKQHKSQSFNLSAYHAPIFQDNSLFVLYDGIRRYDAATGRLLWQKKFGVFEGDLAKSYAEPWFDDDNVYVAGEGKVRALRLSDGEQLWKTDDFGIVTELYADSNVLYGKLGGQFFDFAGNEWDRKGPFGAVALDPKTGKKIWKWNHGDNAVTNLLIFGDRVYFADGDDLFALSRVDGKKVYKQSHHFSKPPKYLSFNESGRLVLIGEENAAGFDYADGQRLWYHELKPPGHGFWKHVAAGFLVSTGAILAVTSYGVALHRGLLPAAPSPVSRIFNYQSRLIKLGKAAGKGMIGAGGDLLQLTRYAQLDGNHQYFFTRLPKGKGLVGVNLTRGVVDETFPMRDENVALLVSELNKIVIQAEGTRLVASPLQRESAPVLKN